MMKYEILKYIFFYITRVCIYDIVIFSIVMNAIVIKDSLYE